MKTKQANSFCLVKAVGLCVYKWIPFCLNKSGRSLLRILNELLWRSLNSREGCGLRSWWRWEGSIWFLNLMAGKIRGLDQSGSCFISGRNFLDHFHINKPHRVCVFGRLLRWQIIGLDVANQRFNLKCKDYYKNCSSTRGTHFSTIKKCLNTEIL